MTNNESRRYKHDIKRVGDLAERPVEMFKREYDDKTSLVLKSRNIPENEIFVNINGISSVNPIYINTNVIPFQMSIDLDLSKSKYHYIKLEDDLFVNDIINFENGIEYKFYVSQDEVGSHNITFGNGINGLFKEFGLNLEPNTTTLIKIIPINNILYIEFDMNSREETSNYGSLSFTIDTTLGSNAGPSFQLPIKPNYLDITNNINYEFNYDFIVDWGDGQSDHITSVNDTTKNHIYSTDGEYTITLTGLVEGFGNLALNLFDVNYGYIDESEIFNRITTMDFEKIISVGNLGNIGLIDAGCMFGFMEPLLNINNIDTTNWNVSTIKNMQGMFAGCSSLTTLDVSNWDVSNVSDMSFMIDNCESLTTLDVSNWDVFNVTNMESMFYNCESLTTLDVSDWNVSNVRNMQQMFDNCSSLETLDVSNWDVSIVNNMSFMFNTCPLLATLDVSNWDVSNVSDMQYMFYNCSSLTTLDVSNWNVSNVNNMSFMFNTCPLLATLDVSNWDVSNVSDMYAMFNNCTSLTTLDVSNWDVSNVINMGHMFNNCTSLTTLDVSNWDVSNVSDMRYMFWNCYLLATLDVSTWNVSNVTNMNGVFTNTPLNTTSYDSLLIEWSQLPSLQSNVQFDAGLAKYQSLEASKARQHIIDTYGWTINDAGQTDAFKFTIDTTLGTGDSMLLPLREGYNYNMLVDWGDGQTSEITSWDDAEKNHTYVSGGTYNVSVRGVCEAWYSTSNEQHNAKFISINQWGNTSFINMCNAFQRCRNLQNINDTDGTWCKNVVDMNGMFDVCKLLTTLDVSNWDVSNVIDMLRMFQNCSSLTTLDVSNWDVSNVNIFYTELVFDETTFISSMFQNTPLDTASYDALLIGWSQLSSLQPNLTFGANLAQYSSGAAADARQYIIDTYGWTINDAGQVV